MEARASDVFVGRARELERLVGVLDGTRAGRGATVLVAGEAGIGKTRLTSELAARARDTGFEVLLGRSIDLVGTELPYQPFAEALRPVGELPRAEGQLRVFEDTLALLTSRAGAAPVLLVLEDLHWADTSTLDLVVYLAHNVRDRPVLLVATYRADEPSSAERMLRLAGGVRRSGSSLVLELGPLDRGDLAALVAAYDGGSRPAAEADAIVARSEGNPFFAQELLAAAGDGGLPRGLRELLLQRVNRLDRRARGVVRIAAAAGRAVGYQLLRAVAAMPEQDVRESLRQAVEHGVLVAETPAGGFRFRHALLAEAVYATVLPGEREEIHERLAEQLARIGAAGPAELAPHWAAAGRSAEALAASVAAARQAQAGAGLAEARAHLERVLTLWPLVPDAAVLAGADLAGICAWAAELAGDTGTAPRAVELARRAIELVGDSDPRRAAMLHVGLGEYLHATGADVAGLAALRRAVELAPSGPSEPERAYALGSLAGGLMVAWRHAESLPVAEQALALARAAGADNAVVRALTVRGADLAYLGATDDGLADLRGALELAETIGDLPGLERVYTNFTDALLMVGRPREAAELGHAGLEAIHRYGVDSAVLVSNRVEALLAIGDWDEADTLSAAALRSITGSFPYMLLMLRADLEAGRGDFAGARSHLDAAVMTLREDRGLGIFDIDLAELALWERRWADADEHASAALAGIGSREAAQLRVWFCAKGLRALAELAGLAHARRDAAAERSLLERSDELIAIARQAAEQAAAVTTNGRGWLALAEAEYQRTRGVSRADLWAEAADDWTRLDRAPLVAYCRWREAEALVATGATRAEASKPLGMAYAIAIRIGAQPLRHELELLAERARLDVTTPRAEPEPTAGLGAALGLTAREAEVLTLLARGYTNKEIAADLVISVRTAGVHVSHILHKLGAPNRLEAAAIAHRLAARAPIGPEDY
jgi:DNA-binding CsgD family transcriptional regulator/tetratricopeptide (TPR) repeat protein